MNYSITLQNYQFSFYAELITAGWTQRWLEGPMKRHRYLAGVSNHLMTQWIDPVLSTERNTNGILMVIGTGANDWLQPHGGWCWHFHPISTAYRHQRKRNFETCLHGEKEEEKPRGETKSVQSPFLGNRLAVFQQENDTHTHTFLPSRHTHKYLYWTEASFPALLYLIHIKYHFPEKISSLLGTERSHLDYCLQAINKNWILSPITVVCSAGPRSPKTSLMRSRWENWHVWPPYIMISKVVKLMVSN